MLPRCASQLPSSSSKFRFRNGDCFCAGHLRGEHSYFPKCLKLHFWDIQYWEPCGTRSSNFSGAKFFTWSVATAFDIILFELVLLFTFGNQMLLQCILVLASNFESPSVERMHTKRSQHELFILRQRVNPQLGSCVCEHKCTALELCMHMFAICTCVPHYRYVPSTPIHTSTDKCTNNYISN